MKNSNHTKSVTLRELYLRAAEMRTPQERAAFLEGACGDDLALRGKVEALLKENAEDSFLENPAIEDSTKLTGTPLTEGPGTLIGRYKLLQKVGEGGMGVVYMAEQTEPVSRKVALKIIKLGMDTRQVVARFEAERQALALMDHPNIATVLDAGATDTGRPYFVMELVRGVPITEYCDKNKLSTLERLKLFIPVCQAIQHAHHKGVIHRDIKPSNVMVTLNDGVPHAMVIDFGVAKATNQKLTEKTLFTNYAQMIGTPAYMSPEQAEMSKLDVDTRTDVYSLGVLLYELLTGTTPFPSKELLSLGYGKLQRVIAEQEPPKPSTRLSTMQNEERTVVAKNRSMEVSALGSTFKGDLDWIVMKALEKDRTHRYETVNGLAADIKRHLNNEPVSAAAPTFRYQLSKFARRNKKYTRAAAAAAGCLLVTALIASWQAVRAIRAQRATAIAQAVAVREARDAETARAAASEKESLARQSETRAQKLVLLADTRDAQRALDVEDIGLAARLMERHRSPNGEPDRTWESRHLWLKCQGDYSRKIAQLVSAAHSLSISREGKWVAIGRSDYLGTNILEVLNLDSGKRHPRAPIVIYGRVRTAFSPTQDLLAFNSQRSANAFGDDILLWNPTTGETVRFSVEGPCEGLAFDDDGRTLFVANNTRDTNSTIVRWAVDQQKLLASVPVPHLGGNLGISESFTVDGSGRLVAYTSSDNRGSPGTWDLNRLEVMDLGTTNVLWSKVTAEDPIMCLALSRDGSLLASAGGWGAEDPRLFDAQTGDPLATLPGHFSHVKELVFWPDGKMLATASEDQALRVWDLKDPRHPRLLRLFRGHRTGIWQAALSPDGARLVSGDRHGTVLLWDAVRPREVPSEVTLPVSSGIWRFTAGGKSLIAVDDGWVVRFSGNYLQERERLLEVGTNLLFASFSNNGKFLGSGSPDGYVVVCDIDAGLVHRQKLAESPIGVVMTEDDGSVVVAAISYRNPWYDLETWDWSLSKRIRSIPMRFGAQPFGVASADGRWYLRTNDGVEAGALLIDRHSGLPGTPISLQVPTVACFSPNGSLFALRMLDSSVKVYQTETQEELNVFTAHVPKSSWSLLAFSPDGTRLVTGGADRYGLRLWDIETGQPTISFSSSDSAFTWASFSPDGKWLGASSKKKLHLWYAPPTEEIKRLSAQRATEAG